MDKFIENPQHIFECYYPPSPEKIEFFPHPVYPIGSYTNGIMEVTVEGWNLCVSNSRGYVTVSPGWEKTEHEEFYSYFPGSSRDRQGQVRLRTETILVFECYNGTELEKYDRVLLRNHNPYDLRTENLTTADLLVKEGNYNQYLESAKAFKDLSHELLDEKAKEAIDKGLDPVQYLDLIVGNGISYYRSWKKKYLKVGLG